MISVEQIRALEDRIEKALAFIASLKAENAEFRAKFDRQGEVLAAAERRAEEAGLRVLELEEAAESFRKDQLRIEEGIIHALEKLDAFEDLVLRGETPRSDLSQAAIVESPPVFSASAKPIAEAQAASEGSKDRFEVAAPDSTDLVPDREESMSEDADYSEVRTEVIPSIAQPVPAGRPATDELDIF